MPKHCRKSLWNLLDKKERRAVIAMLQNYIKKADQNENNPNQNRNENYNHIMLVTIMLPDAQMK